MKRVILLIPLILIALALRLYRINEPLADWHSWRQADTAAVTRRFVQEGIDLFHPRYDDVSSIPSGKENPQGYRMVEFPFVNAATAWAYQTVPGAGKIELHVFSRIISILFSLGSLVFLYFIVRLFSDELTAWIAAFLFALLPYNIYFSRVVLPEVPLVFFSLGSVYFMARKVKRRKTWKSWEFWFSAIFASLALLLKPYAIFLAPPLVYLKFKHHGLKLLKHPATYVFLTIAIVPMLVWRQWIQHFPEGIPAFWWLLNGNAIRFKGAFFRWLFAERLGKLLLGYWGLIPFGLGVIVKPSRNEGWFYNWWLFGMLGYLTVFATGNVQHDYYQILLVPIVCIFVAKGFVSLLHPGPLVSKPISYALAATSFLFMLAFGWFHIRDYFNINHPEIVEAGKVANELLPQDARVIAPYQGDTAFLYQINRRGWPIGGTIAEKVHLGATDYVTTTFDQEAQTLASHCTLRLQTETFALIDLRGCEL